TDERGSGSSTGRWGTTSGGVPGARRGRRAPRRGRTGRAGREGRKVAMRKLLGSSAGEGLRTDTAAGTADRPVRGRAPSRRRRAGRTGAREPAGRREGNRQLSCGSDYSEARYGSCAPPPSSVRRVAAAILPTGPV